MIDIFCSDNLYTYNACHLARAFFPDVPARVSVRPSQDEAVVFDIDIQGSRHVAIRPAQTKAEVDKEIYRALSAFTGKTLPWGLLTGVRPTKPAMVKIKEGMSRDEFVRWYGEEKFVSREKAELAYNIAQKELCILNKITDDWSDTCSIYIGIPFCPGICSYCSFSLGTVSAYADMIDSYVSALCREIRLTADMIRGRKISSIYIGGGTPTSLNEVQLSRLLEAVTESFDVSAAAEFCVEAGRPDTVTAQKLAIIKKSGAGRLCVNPQTMRQETLDRVGRAHSADDVYRAFSLAREAGFDNINMDIIAGLPGEDVHDMEDTLSKILALSPESLTVHALSIKRRAQMESQSTPQETVSEMIEEARKKALAAGMEPYYLYRQKSIAGNFENVGYAKPGREGLYNILTMEEVQSVYGLGAGAETKVVLDHAVPNPSRGGKPGKILRCSNVKDVREYIKRADEMARKKAELGNI